MIDWLALIALQGFLLVLNLLPLFARIWLVRTLLIVVSVMVPSFKRVSLRNISLAFPERSPSEQEEIYLKSLDELSRLFVDFARLPTLSKEWIHKHIECPFLGRFKELKNNSEGRGVLIATAHLGSFELLAFAIAAMGFPVSFIVRNFSLPRVDAWWTKSREQFGNEVIPRRGAVKKVLASLTSGRDVALLFDQNVTRNHAVFVPLFGKEAATTQTLGVAAVRTNAKLVVATMKYVGQDHYKIVAQECNCDDVYASDSLSLDEKVFEITLRTHKILESMIREFPEGWFWMHRRWKTQREGIAEDFYK